MKKVSLENIKDAHRAGNIFNGNPDNWDIFDESVPQELIDAWKIRSEADKNFVEILKKHGVL